MLEVIELQRDQAGDPAFRDRYEAAIDAKFEALPVDRDPEDPTDKYEAQRYATGRAIFGGGTVFVQVDEDLVSQTGGDAAVTIAEEAFMVLMNQGNREPRAFARIEPA